MATETQQLTAAGYRKLENELQDLKTNQRTMIAQKIAEAREQGDLSENAEYSAAKDEQRQIEGRIEQLTEILKHAEIIGGMKAKILDLEYDEELDLTIVGPTEANSLQGKISNDSPVGKALQRAKVGDVITVETPEGDTKYKVLSIEAE